MIHLDGGADSGPGIDECLCNPLAQLGCAAGEKCGWIYDQLTPSVFGHICCEPDGATPIGGACGARALGPDPCVEGAECVDGVCRQICDNQGGAPGCDAAQACVEHQGLFQDGTATIAGVCEPMP